MIIQQDPRFKKNLSHLIGEIEWSRNWKNHILSLREEGETRNYAINLEDLHLEIERNACSVESSLKCALENTRNYLEKTKEYIIIAEQLAQKTGLTIQKDITKRILEIGYIEKKFKPIKNGKDSIIRSGIKNSIEGIYEMKQLGLEKCAKEYMKIARSFLWEYDKRSWFKFRKNPAAYLNQT